MHLKKKALILALAVCSSIGAGSALAAQHNSEFTRETNCARDVDDNGQVVAVCDGGTYRTCTAQYECDWFIFNCRVVYECS